MPDVWNELFWNVFGALVPYSIWTNPNQDNILPALFIAVLLFVFLYSTTKLLIEARSCRKQILRMEQHVRDLDYRQMRREYEDIKAKLVADPDHGHLWNEFYETIVTIHEEDKVRVFNTRESKEFFNEATLIEPYFHLRYFDATPGILTGIGILGTFLGLVVGLSGIDLGTENSDELMNGISALLGGAKL